MDHGRQAEAGRATVDFNRGAPERPLRCGAITGRRAHTRIVGWHACIRGRLSIQSTVGAALIDVNLGIARLGNGIATTGYEKQWGEGKTEV